MFSFFKQKASSQDVAEALFDKLRRNSESDYRKNMLPDEATLSMELIRDEWLYFDAFILDSATFLAFGETPARHAILDPFSSLVANWLRTRKVLAITEPRLIIATYEDAANPTILPLEPYESALQRFKRRLSIYAQALKTPCTFGQNYRVAVTFMALCGFDSTGVNYIMGISSYFATASVEYANVLKALA